MDLSPEDQKLADSIIVVGYLFVYDGSWQDIPHYIQLHLTKELPHKKVYDKQKIKARWEDLQKEEKGTYAEWYGKKRSDKAVTDFCLDHKLWAGFYQ